jgi:hypothetical protein
MANLKYDKEIAALLVIDPYNDFISEGGKVWDRLRGVAEANNCVPNMFQVLNGCAEGVSNFGGLGSFGARKSRRLYPDRDDPQREKRRQKQRGELATYIAEKGKPLLTVVKGAPSMLRRHSHPSRLF